MSPGTTHRELGTFQKTRPCLRNSLSIETGDYTSCFLKHLSSAVSLSQLLITGLIGVLFPVILYCRCIILQVCKRLNTPVSYPRHTGKCFSDRTETVRTSDFPDPTTFLDSTQNKLLLEGARTIILQNRVKSRALASELNILFIDITKRIYNKNVTIN